MGYDAVPLLSGESFIGGLSAGFDGLRKLLAGTIQTLCGRVGADRYKRSLFWSRFRLEITQKV